MKTTLEGTKQSGRLSVWILVFFANALVGCSTLYKSDYYARQCSDVDWEQLHYDVLKQQDKASKNQLSNMNFVCPINGVQPDPKARDRAISKLQREICNQKGAVRWGRDGLENPKICAPQTQEVFDKHWKMGYRDYLIIQLSYLQRNGIFLETVTRHLKGSTPFNTNPIEYARISAHADLDAIEELEIKRMHITDESEKKALISDLSKRLDNLVRQ